MAYIVMAYIDEGYRLARHECWRRRRRRSYRDLCHIYSCLCPNIPNLIVTRITTKKKASPSAGTPAAATAAACRLCRYGLHRHGLHSYGPGTGGGVCSSQSVGVGVDLWKPRRSPCISVIITSNVALHFSYNHLQCRLAFQL